MPDLDFLDFQKNNLKSLKNIFLTLTAAILLFPSAVNFSHIFLGHDHKLCDHYAEKHFHDKKLDCDLYKFHSNPALEINFPDYTIFSESVTQVLPSYQYFFISDSKPLSNYLRGPPAVA